MISERMQELAGISINESKTMDYTELDKKIKELFNFGIMIFDKHYDTMDISSVNSDNADEWVIYIDGNQISGKYPKRGLTLDIILNTIEKKKANIDFSNVIRNMKYPKDVEELVSSGVFTPTSFGYTSSNDRIKRFHGSIEQATLPLFKFLDKHKITYTTDISKKEYMFRVKLSKSKQNLENILRIQK